MKKEIFNPEELARPLSAYSHCVRKGNTVYTSGQIAIDSKGSVAGKGNIEVQTRQVIDNLVTALAAAGATLEDVVKVTVFLKNIDDCKGMNKVYAEYFRDSVPARSTVVAALALNDLLVEIEAIAVID